MDEPSGSVAADWSGNGRNGAYTGVTLGAAGIGDGSTCPSLDGVNDVVPATAAFRDAFDTWGEEGTMALWAKIADAAEWTAGLARIFRFRRDDDNGISLYKAASAATIKWYYKAAASSSGWQKDGFSTLDWMHFGLSWSKTAQEARAYYDGVQYGDTDTSVGDWAEGSMDTARCLLGGGSVIGEVWKGWLAHFAVWSVALTPAEIARLAVLR